jgi:dihydrofolate synthase / folylpolyglutamate synthase
MCDLAYIKRQCLSSIYNKTYTSSRSHLKVILNAMKLPKNMLVVTVGGTNGKGSTISIIERALLDYGFSVLVNTSPHIKEYNERVRFNGASISDITLIDGITFIDKIALDEGLVLSFPDYSFLLVCYVAMCRINIDILLLEVGLGGEYDPSNILNADISVLTNIDLDHTDILGKTREEILEKKIAIARKGKALVVGDPNPPLNLESLVISKGCNLYLCGRDFAISDYKLNTNLPVHTNNIAIAGQVISLISQEMNKEMQLTVDILKKIDLKARAELLSRGHEFFLLDVAHNRQAVNNLFHKIKDIKKRYKFQKVTAIFTAISTKPIAGMISDIASIIDEWKVFSIDSIDARGASQLDLKYYFRDIDEVSFFDIKDNEFKNILMGIRRNELTIVFGSFVLIGEFLKIYDLQVINEK